MSITTTAAALTAEEVHAAIYALASDLSELADNLRKQADGYTEAQLDRQKMHAADLAGAARMIGNLAAPIDALIAQLPTEVK